MSAEPIERNTRASNLSVPNKISGAIAGLILGVIYGSLNAAFNIATVILLLPFTLIYSLFTSYSYFRKQNKYNPVLSALLSLLLLIPATYFNYFLIATSINSLFTNARVSAINGFKKGFLATLKTISINITKIPANTFSAVKFAFSKSLVLWNTVNLPRDRYVALMKQQNREVYNRELAFISIAYQNHRIARVLAVDELGRRFDRTKDNVGIFNSLFNLIKIWGSDYIIATQQINIDAQNTATQIPTTQIKSLELTDNLSKYTINKDEMLTSEQLEHLRLTNPNDVELYESILLKIKEGECSITFSAPTEEEKIVLYSEYTTDKSDMPEDNKDWHTVPSKIFIYEKQSFEHWMTINRINPMNREKLDAPPKYHANPTRYRYCKVHGQDGALVLPALREVRDKLYKDLSTQINTANTFQPAKDSNDFVNGVRSQGATISSGGNTIFQKINDASLEAEEDSFEFKHNGIS